MRSTTAPMIKVVVMTAKAIWNSAYSASGILGARWLTETVPAAASSRMAENQARSSPPNQADDLLNASE